MPCRLNLLFWCQVLNIFQRTARSTDLYMTLLSSICYKRKVKELISLVGGQQRWWKAGGKDGNLIWSGPSTPFWSSVKDLQQGLNKRILSEQPDQQLLSLQEGIIVVQRGKPPHQVNDVADN
jgi:accessory colonization factor AcfC